MKSLSVLLLAVALVLTSCASRTSIERVPLQGAMGIVVQKHHLAFAVPSGWHELKATPADAVFAAEADNGNMRFVVSGPLGGNDGTSKHELVANHDYQRGIQRALLKGAFAKIDHAELTPVAGVNAFRCEATGHDKSHSILQIHLPRNNQLWVITFLSKRLKVSQVSSIQSIVKSFQFTP